MNKWKELDNVETAVSIITTMVESMDMIQYLIRNAAGDPDKFDYHVHIADHSISLYDNGHEFASANTDHFNNAGDLMMWVTQALNEYYYDYCEPDDPIVTDYTSVKYKKGGRR